MAQIELGALSPSISEQLAAQGLEQTGGDRVDLLDRMADAITLLYLHGYMTAGETERARKRLVKKLKPRQLPPQ